MTGKLNQVQEYRVYELPAQFPVLLLDGESWHISPVRRERLHFHNCLEIGICHSGSGTLQVCRDTLPFRAGDVTCLPQNIPHTTWSSEGDVSLWSYLFVDLRGLLFHLMPGESNFELIYPLLSQDRYLFSEERSRKIHFLANSILGEVRQQGENHDLIVRSLFLALFCELKRQFTQPQADPGAPQDGFSHSLALAPAIHAVYTDYMNPLNIQRLADCCHMSQTHFRRTFLAIMGTSPLQFINALRVDRAALLLSATSDAVMDIAQAVGFASLSSFNRCFVRLKRVSPRDFRAAARQNGSAGSEKTRVIKYAGWKQPER